MKKLFLFFSFGLTTSLSFSQNISDVSQSGARITVYDAKNNQISSKLIGSDVELCGFSSTIIVIKSDIRVTVYDEKFNQISSKLIGSDAIIKNVSGNNIIIKAGGRVTTYDKMWNQISSRLD